MSRIDNPSPLRQREPRVRDKGYLAWLHDGLPCIACLIERRVHMHPIEACHMKLAIAPKGWREGGGGVRVDDSRCCPLCTHHHRIAPDACDNGQRAFWDRLKIGDDVADFCRELYSAYQSSQPGLPVILKYAKRD